MMFPKNFGKKEDKTKELEKRIEQLEKQLEEEMGELKKRTKDQIRDLGESLRVMKEVTTRVQKEKNELQRERNFLVAKHKELIRQIPLDRAKLKKDIRHKLLMPLHRKIKENANLVREVAKEGIVEEEREEREAPEWDKERGENAKKSDEEYRESIKSAIVTDETKTPLDELFELVMNEGAVKISDAARKFSVSEGQLEEWARILESHGLIEIHYPPVGRPELRKKVQEE